MAARTQCDWLKWLPDILNTCTFRFNVIIFLFFKDYLTFKYARADNLSKIRAAFLAYLTEVVSFDYYERALTKTRCYSEQILLCFESEKRNLSAILEKLFREAQRRNQLTQYDEIRQGRDNFGPAIGELQSALKKHCGVIK